MSVPSSVPPMQSTPDTDQDARTFSIAAYILGIVTSFVGPLIIWLIKKDQSRFIAYHALQATILQVTVWVLVGVGVAMPFGWALIDKAIYAVGVIFSILALLAANKGEWYEIPVIGRFTKKQVGA